MMRHAKTEAQAIAKQAASTVSFAVTHSLSLTFFPRWLREIERDAGPLSIALFSHDAERCHEALAEGQCHFMICHFDSRMSADYDMGRVRSASVGKDRLIPVTRPSEQSIAPQLPGAPGARLPYLAYTEGSAIGRSLELFLRDKTAARRTALPDLAGRRDQEHDPGRPRHGLAARGRDPARARHRRDGPRRRRELGRRRRYPDVPRHDAAAARRGKALERDLPAAAFGE